LSTLILLENETDL